MHTNANGSYFFNLMLMVKDFIKIWPTFFEANRGFRSTLGKKNQPNRSRCLKFF
jgi:hypothetical protein